MFVLFIQIASYHRVTRSLDQPEKGHAVPPCLVSSGNIFAAHFDGFTDAFLQQEEPTQNLLR